MESPNLKLYAETLGINKSQLSDLSAVRAAFKKKVLDPYVSANRKKRISLNQAYSQVCAIIYKSKVSQMQQLIIDGNIQAIKKKIKQNKKCLDEKINQYPPIYLAVRCGHYDVVEFLLKAGCSLDFKNDRSTPMHCAAYYAYNTNHSIIPLLFMYGIPTNIRNVFGCLPIQQASSSAITRLLQVSQGSKIKQLHEKLLDQGIGVAIINLKEQKTGQVVIKKLIHKNYFKYWNHSQYDDAYHGTHVDNLFSIMKNGLRRPGDKVDGALLEVVEGHVPLGTNVSGFKDWSRAIFLSPSVYYSAHPVYAKEFFDSEQVWLPLLQVKVKKGSYSRHDHTLLSYNVKNSQPVSLEFRVTCADNEKDLIIRSERIEEVVVIATILIKKGYLDEHDNYKETSQLILHSEEEKNFRKHNVKC